MNAKRKKVEEYIYKLMKDITKSDFNTNLYKDFFKKMTDKDFDNFMHKVKDGSISLFLIIDKDSKITIEDNLKISEKIGLKTFQKLIYTNEDGKLKTANDFLVLRLPLRRTKQTSEKGVSVGEDSKHLNAITGQVSGVSAGTKLTLQEVQLMNGMGLKHSVIELLRDRGGDSGSMKVLLEGLKKNGSITQKLTSDYSTGVTSKAALKAYLTSIHLKTTL